MPVFEHHDISPANPNALAGANHPRDYRSPKNTVMLLSNQTKPSKPNTLL